MGVGRVVAGGGHQIKEVPRSTLAHKAKCLVEVTGPRVDRGDQNVTFYGGGTSCEWFCRPGKLKMWETTDSTVRIISERTVYIISEAQ